MPSRGLVRKYVVWTALVVFAIGCTGALVAYVGQRSVDPASEAAAAYQRKDYTRAAELARGRLKTAPSDLAALKVLARASARLGRDTAANAMFSKLGSEALDAEDLFLLGVGLDHAKQKDSAEAVWKKAISLRPDHGECLSELIVRDLEQSRIGEAADRAAQLSRIPGWELRGELKLGTLRAELSDPAGAVAALRRALARPDAAKLDDPAICYYRKLLARNLLKTGQSKEAFGLLFLDLERHADPEASWLQSRASLQEGDIPRTRSALVSSSDYRTEHPLETEPTPYVGAAQCVSCHQEQAETWEHSRHSTTLSRGVDVETLPYPDRTVVDPDNPSVTHTFLHEKGGRIRSETRVKDRVYEAVVAYAFGSPDRYLSLVANDPSGQPYILRMSRFQSGSDSGWVRTTGHSPDAEGDTNYQGKPVDRAHGIHACLFCHATDPRAVLDRSGPVAEDRAIGCERCHGPGGNHLKAVAAKLDDLSIVNPAKGPTEGRIRVCGQCHSQHQPSNLPRTDPFWLRFQSTTLTWSRCYTESSGALDCGSCHNPHGDAKLTEVQQDRHCLKCHATAPATARAAGASASRTVDHAVQASICKVNATSGCVKCHMPSTRSAAIRASYTDHYIRVHPDKSAANSR